MTAKARMNRLKALAEAGVISTEELLEAQSATE